MATVTFTLTGHTEKWAQDNEQGQRRLYHQQRTYEALRDYAVVINTYNTGTGKTKAALQRLIDLNRQGVNVLFIAPTNELISQHIRDVQEFVKEAQLDYHVLPARAHDVRILKGDLRPGETLHRLIQNYAEFEDHITQRQAVVMVTNPDIFYYAIYFQYGPHDKRNVFSDFVQRFDYLIVDEFHYYNNKQIANFLFALALFDEFGYFNDPQRQRRVCLLSATPRENVQRYLFGLFGDRLKLIAPTNESPESKNYERVHTLAPLEVTIIAGDLTDWIQQSSAELVSWVKTEGLDGVVISNSLGRINEVYRLLERSLDNTLMGRITGPEAPEARAAATARRLILATPTVDIGYNFDKLNKPERQNIDFVVCEVQYQDDLIQRIGRAGRVLRKHAGDIPSRAVVLVSEAVANALKPLNGQTLTRTAFMEALTKIDDLPAKHQIEDYIRHYAVPELIWPLYQLRRAMAEDALPVIDALYARVCQLLSPGMLNRQWSVTIRYKVLESRERWSEAVNKKQDKPPEGTAKQIIDWMKWLDGTERDERTIQPHVDQLWRNNKQALIDFVESQITLEKALFNFRDSFQGPVAVFYDPHGWFSSKPINSYDIFHLLSYYDISLLEGRNRFIESLPANVEDEPIPDEDFYVHLLRPRDEPLVVEFVLQVDQRREDFDRRWIRLPVAMRNFKLRVRERGGDPIWGGVHEQINSVISRTPVVCMIVPPQDSHVIRSRLTTSGVRTRRLTITFDGGESRDDYQLLVGVAAFEAHAHLKPYLARIANRQTDPIIC
jgi:CRISPR-associated endonuclease/helicase Cas3